MVCRSKLRDAEKIMQSALQAPKTPTQSELAMLSSADAADIANLIQGSGSNLRRKYYPKVPVAFDFKEEDDAAYDTDLETESRSKAPLWLVTVRTQGRY